MRSSSVRDKAKGERMIYDCPECDSPQHFSPICVHQTALTQEGFSDDYILAKCDKCDRPALFNRLSLGDLDDDFPYRLWPPLERHVEFKLPEIVRDSYEEAVRCENAKSFIATAVMVRRALEAVCKEYDPKSKSIYAALQNMLKNGVISEELMEWATELRVIGNRGAHATSEKITRTEAKEALDFLQAILEIFYDLRPKFKQMQDRKKKAE
jgi:Domain of unknown function (DUF4145)